MDLLWKTLLAFLALCGLVYAGMIYDDHRRFKAWKKLSEAQALRIGLYRLAELDAAAKMDAQRMLRNIAAYRERIDPTSHRGSRA